MLFLAADRNKNTGWEGYDIIVNRKKVIHETTSIERHRKNFKWQHEKSIDLMVNDTKMELKFPKSLTDTHTLDFEFK